MSRRSKRRRRAFQRAQTSREERNRLQREKLGITDETREPLPSEGIAPTSRDTEDAPEHDPSEIGRAPGELPAASPFESEGPTRFRLIWYNRNRYETREFSDPSGLSSFLRDDRSENTGVVWVQMMGLTDPDIVHLVGGMFRIPMLAQEDILSIWSRPKFDEYGESEENGAGKEEEIILAVANAVHLRLGDAVLPKNNDGDGDGEESLENVPLDDAAVAPNAAASDNNTSDDDDDGSDPRGQQISILAGPNFVISFHENRDLIFEAVERRIIENTKRARFWRPGFLFYALFDTLVDRMLYLTEEIEDAIDDLEDKILPKEPDINVETVYALKRFVVRLRRLVSPLGKIVSSIRACDNHLFDDFPEMYISDLNDHVLRVGDRVEHARAILQDLQDYHHTLQERKTNDIIRVLTVMSSIFIPLTFVVGLYGMNFKFMPELESPYGYPVCLGLMATFAGGIFLLFKRKKWI
ncbi:MAG: hypothetical protein LBT53_08515 [Puniceicoccales bacterium]|jgi:magnesium/cobalt transport protein CorA|nr:hypothetical protein [Puniceicoccales bacterium]